METEQIAKITITYPELVKEIEEIFNGEWKESETVEFKESISQMDNSLKTICAFLNNNGGRVYFGISDKGNPTGINLSDANIREISQKIMLKIKPEITPKISDHRINDIPVLKISVEKGINNIYYCNGVAYDRSGTSTVIMPPDEIRRRIIENNQTQWERLIFKKADLTYLNIPTINKFLEMAKKAKRIPGSK
ncbi:MAG: AlbA family DNA-binding domain-containing protein, partial [Candidatus Humimicrobiaceae bacterium]